jgi:hypothetical protein
MPEGVQRRLIIAMTSCEHVWGASCKPRGNEAYRPERRRGAGVAGLRYRPQFGWWVHDCVEFVVEFDGAVS